MRKVFLLIIDMDGAIYNHHYRTLIRYVVAENAGFLSILESGLIANSEINKLISILIEDLRELQLDDLDSDFETGRLVEPSLRWYEKELAAGRIILPTGISFPPDEVAVTSYLYHHIKIMYRHAPDLYECILEISNRNLFRYLSMERIDFDDIELISGTNRVTSLHDHWGIYQNGTGSAYKDFTILQAICKRMFPNHRVHLHLFSPTDAHRHVPPGTTFADAMTLDLDVSLENKSGHYYDETKLTNIYGAIHYARCEFEEEFPNELVHYKVIFIDDQTNIIDTLALTFGGKNNLTELLPVRTLFFPMVYVGYFERNLRGPFWGVGSVDKDYCASLRLMVASCGYSSRTTIDTALEIDLDEFVSLRDGIGLAGLGLFRQKDQQERLGEWFHFEAERLLSDDNSEQLVELNDRRPLI